MLLGIRDGGNHVHVELGTIGIVQNPAAVTFPNGFHHRSGVMIGLDLDAEHGFQLLLGLVALGQEAELDDSVHVILFRVRVWTDCSSEPERSLVVDLRIVSTGGTFGTMKPFSK